jgi:hypothetical protein
LNFAPPAKGEKKGRHPATQFALRGSSDCPRKPATEATGLDFQSEFVDCRRLVRANQQLVVMLIAYTRYSG